MIFSKLSTYKIEIFCVYKFILFYENVYINIYKKTAYRSSRYSYENNFAFIYEI